MTLAEKITALRGEHKLSQGDLAEQLDVSRQSVSKWETGQAVPELEKIIKLADLFDVSVDELVREGETLPPEAPQADRAQASEPEAPSPTEPHIKIVYMDRKSLTPLQKFGIVALVLGALTLFCGAVSMYIPIFGVPMILLSLPLILAKKHPWLIDGWLLCLGSCVIFNPHFSIVPWGLRGGIQLLSVALSALSEYAPGARTYLFGASIAIARGILFLVLVFLTARLFFRARAARKQSGSEEIA